VGDGTIDPDGPRNVYRYRINRTSGRVFLSDRQLLATAEVGIADGVKVDVAGNVWYSTGAGLHALSPVDEVLGAVAVPGGAANFAITEEGIFVMGETGLYLLLRAEDSHRD
jgi:gluconolactonase